MAGQELMLRGFASPHIGLDDSLVDLLVVEHGRHTVEKFLDRYQRELSRNGTGLRDLLNNWLSRDEGFETVWNPTFGEVYASLFLESPHDIEKRGGALALRLSEFGQIGEWDLHFDEPVQFRFDRWILPSSKALEVAAAGRAVSIRVRLDQEWRKIDFHRQNNHWEAAEPPNLQVVSKDGVRWTILGRDSIAPSSAGMLHAQVLNFGDSDIETQLDLLKNTCHGALEVITEYAPVYLAWVTRVIRELVPLRPRPGMFDSASHNLSPGVICTSNQNSRWGLAEVFVHESSHQYLHILTKLGRLDDGTDSTLYFSPIRNCGRPIDFILLSYHAFANLALFYSTAREHGFAGDEEGAYVAETRLDVLQQQLAVLETALKTTHALTALGRALWEPLYERLHAQ